MSVEHDNKELTWFFTNEGFESNVGNYLIDHSDIKKNLIDKMMTIYTGWAEKRVPCSRDHNL